MHEAPETDELNEYSISDTDTGEAKTEQCYVTDTSAKQYDWLFLERP